METAALQREIRSLEQSAERLAVPFNAGDLVYRRWQGPADAATVLLAHGGSGSWLHWFRNIALLRQRFNVVTVDLPGLGDSSALADGYSAEDAVSVFVDCTQELMGGQSFHILAFSWGCAVSSQAAARLEPQLRSLMLIGPASLGDIPRRGFMGPLIRRTPDMSQAEVHAANRENLAQLMIHDRERIDDMAVLLQTLNTQNARFNSPQFARTTLVLDGVAKTSVPVKVVYGEHDAPALPDIAGKKALFEAANPQVQFEIVPDAGHWLPYEKPDVFNTIALQWLSD